MNILLIGSGGREHAFAYKLTQSTLCDELFIAPGNAGTAKHGTNVALNPLDFATVGDFCLAHQIGLLIVGPEEPLVKGMRDYFMANEALKIFRLLAQRKMVHKWKEVKIGVKPLWPNITFQRLPIKPLRQKI